MQKAWVKLIIIILFICFPVLLAAQQNNDDGPSIESDWEDFFSDLYMKGDQAFIISLGTVFPGLFINNGELIDPNFNPPVGGTGSLSYNYYLSSKYFIGGEIGGMFIHTLRKNTLFIVPLGLRAGTQYIYNRFEFPLTLTMGMTWHKYLDFGYYGFFMKAGGAALFRATSDWSFGLNTDLGWFPQWTDDKSRNVDGSFINVMLVARYHF